jgi:hypothetical protein
MSGGLEGRLARIKEDDKKHRKEEAVKKQADEKEDRRLIEDMVAAAKREAKNRGEKFDREAFLAEHSALPKKSNEISSSSSLDSLTLRRGERGKA